MNSLRHINCFQIEGLDVYPVKKLEYEQMENTSKSLFNGALGK